MNVQEIGRTSYLIVVTREELNKNNLSLSGLNAEEICRLAQLDEPPALGRVCFEIYPGKDELMIFARFGGSGTEAYGFRELEDLIRGAKLCPDMFSSELILRGELYILVMTPWDGETVPWGLSEFGDRLRISAELLPHLREQGRTLISNNALETLRNVF
jgi:hypothetical protein